MPAATVHAHRMRFARQDRAADLQDDRARAAAAPPSSSTASNGAERLGPLDELWRQYHAQPSTEIRDRLVDHYMGSHVKRIAERMKAQVPRQIEVDDLLQVGFLGLVESLNRFDPAKDVKFETYSSRRIFGAMRDYLRQLDPVPRLQRRRERMLQREVERFQKEHGRRPGDDELHERVEIPDAALRSLLGGGRPPLHVQWSNARPDGAGEDADTDAMDALEDHRQTSPLRHAAYADLRRFITRGLSCRDRLVVILYYYERMTMKEIGQTLGISESRVSQRLDAILDCLRSRLMHIGAEQEFVFER